MAVICAAIVAVPGAGYVLEIIRRRPTSKGVAQRVIRLHDLPPRIPKALPIVGSRQDAWTLYPAETVGRVYLVRETDESVVGSDAKVLAFTSICPHLGCQIKLDATGDKFICPCHQAAFNPDGSPVSEELLGHPNQAPRGMDKLECRVVQDSGSNEWWIEVKYQKFEQGLTTQVAKT